MSNSTIRIWFHQFLENLKTRCRQDEQVGASYFEKGKKDEVRNFESIVQKQLLGKAITSKAHIKAIEAMYPKLKTNDPALGNRTGPTSPDARFSIDD